MKSKEIVTYKPSFKARVRLMLVTLIYRLRLIRVFIDDYLIYRKNSFALSMKKNQVSLEAKITLHYHSIEKGLSNTNIRYCFGKKALTNLLYSIDLYIQMKYDSSNPRLISAIRVIDNYLRIHDDSHQICSNIDFEIIRSRFESYVHYLLINGTKYEYKSQVEKGSNTPNSHNTFELLNNRKSIREFQNKTVDIEIIKTIIQIAQKTPSVCNRQPWRIYYLQNPDMIRNVLLLQNGLNIERIKNIKNLFVISIDIRYFANAYERHEPFVAGGMYSMNIMTLLEAYGFGSCSLNTSFNTTTSRKIKELISASKSEVIANMIIFGYKNESYLSPSSDRDPIERVLTII